MGQWKDIFGSSQEDVDPEDERWYERFYAVEQLLGTFCKLIQNTEYAITPWWDRRDAGKARLLLITYVSQFDRLYRSPSGDEHEHT